MLDLRGHVWLSLVAVSRDPSLAAVLRASPCVASPVARAGESAPQRSGFSSCSTWSQAAEHRLNSCGAWASCSRACVGSLLAGLGPVYPALASIYSTTREVPLKLLFFSALKPRAFPEGCTCTQGLPQGRTSEISQKE